MTSNPVDVAILVSYILGRGFPEVSNKSDVGHTFTASMVARHRKHAQMEKCDGRDY